MAALGIDGLISGLDTTTIISQLMQLEAQPQTLLKGRLTTTTTFANDLRSLNTATALIRDAAKAAATAGSLDLFTAKSSATSVTATATKASSSGISFTVGQTAQGHSVVSKAMTVWQESPPVLTIRAKDGTTTEVTASSTSLADVAGAINAADAGVSAVQVAAGTDADGTQLYRLQITSDETGAAGAFQIFRGTAAGIGTGGASVDLSTETGAAIVATARDASITLWGGTAAAQTITSPTNTFGGLVPGLDVTVSAVETTPVTIGVTRNTTAASDVAAKLVSSLASLFSSIASKTSVSTTTDSAGRSVVKGGSLAGDSTTRQLKDSLLRAATDPVAGASPSSIGISVTRDGTVAFDAEKFRKALAEDPQATAAMLSTIAGRVEKAATEAADQYDGYLTGKITGQDAAIKTLNEQISSWDTRLALRRETLQKTYTALETALGTLQSQSTWLTSQLSSLTKSS
ncbi:flagellar filament capping protein FliD [Naasia sp. SYSU D00948]|uniref:flagellar filament capping protein FliD n=1 Tax=Naasia sp. SYSU D00948 TaxID=2817379 RepID=UPI001B308BD3|nr:flagellar filament capping protein FliD [Naasia sp. SYSU D00948]